jgi:hypothetical protein
MSYGAFSKDDLSTLVVAIFTKVKSKIPTKVSQLENDKKYLTAHDCPYAVGDIFITTNTTLPSNRWSGTTWKKIEDKMLIGASSTYPVNTTGGEAKHTLTINEMPSHTHGTSISRVNSTWGMLKNDSAGNTVSVRGEAIAKSSSLSTDATGGAQPHNNLPPYIAVYMWIRMS